MNQEEHDYQSFHRNKRVHLAEIITETPSETTQIGFIFGSLRHDIRKHIPRDAVRTFNILLIRAREVETLLYMKGKIIEFLE